MINNNIKPYKVTILYLIFIYTILFSCTICNADVPEGGERIVWLQPYQYNRHVQANIIALRKYAYYHTGRHYHYIPSIALTLPGPSKFSYKIFDKDTRKLLSKKEGSYDQFGEHIYIFQLPVLEMNKEKNYIINCDIQYYSYDKKEKDKRRIKKNKGDRITTDAFFNRIIEKGDDNYIYTLIDKDGEREYFTCDIVYKSLENKSNDEDKQKNEIINNENKKHYIRNISNENISFLLNGKEEKNYPRGDESYNFFQVFGAKYITILVNKDKEKRYPIIKDNDERIKENCILPD